MKNITVTVCTLNEEENIQECINSIKLENPSEIIVVDAESTDDTKNILKKNDVKLINVEKKGLAYQRKIAIENVNTEYVCILDADHRLTENCLKLLIEELEIKKYDGIEAQIQKFNVEKNYWSDSFDINFKLSHNIPRETIMIGTPCVYKTCVLKKINFDPFFTGPSDDTDLCYRLTKAGFRIGVGSANILHKNRTSFKQFFNKMIWYGKGDAQFIFKHPERIHRMFFHQLINYPIIKSFKAIRNGYFKVIIFFVSIGIIRFISMLINLIKFILVSSKDKKIYRT